MSTYKTKGIIIKRTDLGEADKILTFYTFNLGKKKAVAKGVRKVTSRLAGHLELFLLVDLILAKGKNLDTVISAQTIQSFKGIRQNLEKTSQAYFICELLDKLTPDEYQDTRVYDLLLDTLTFLDVRIFDQNKISLLIKAFEMKLLVLLGFSPELSKCVHCGSEKIGFFSVLLGGALCKKCIRFDARSIKISFYALRLIKDLEQENFDYILKLDLGENQIVKEMEKVIDFYVEFILERRLESKKFVREVEKNASEIHW